MADVARAHGGDGGNRPPRKKPRKVPSRCESSIPKVTRGRGCNKKLMDKFGKNGNKPLDLQVAFVGEHGKFIGKNQSSFIRFISTSIWNGFPMYYKGWNSVPSTYKQQLWDELYHYFDLASHAKDKDHWIKVEAIINRECHRSYSERKCELKTHFDLIDGRNNPELAKLCPPSDFNEERWIEVIDKLYSDPKYLDRCEANKRNRQKHHYVSCHGSESYTQKRWVQTANNEETSYIEGFEDTHTKDGKWVNEAARLDFERLKAERTRIDDGSDDYCDSQVFLNVFGKSRGHLRGIGRIARKAAPPVAPKFGSSAGPSQQDWQESLKAELQQQQQSQMQEMFAKMSQEFDKKLEDAKKQWQHRPNESEDESDD